MRVGNVPEADYVLLQERERRLQAELLTQQATNVELSLRAEACAQVEKECARAKERAAHLEKYVEFLKAEKAQLQLGASLGDQSVASSASLSSTGNVKRVCTALHVIHYGYMPYKVQFLKESSLSIP